MCTRGILSASTRASLTTEAAEKEADELCRRLGFAEEMAVRQLFFGR